MGVKSLLLFIIFVHTCDGSEHNFTVTETYDTTENASLLDGVLYGDYSGDYFEEYIRRRNYSEILYMDYSIPESPDAIIAHVDNIIKEEIILFRQPYNITDLDAVNFNKTTQDTYNITADAVFFLKGLLVTRLMPSFYIIIILISLPLNALALVTFTCKIQEKKPAMIYMSHLACVDLLFTLLLPLKIHYQLNASDWVFGEALCRVFSAAYYCYMYCSILLMMSMSVDRLLAVVCPIASLTWRSARKATCVCVLIWLLALVGTVPLLLVRQTVKTENVGVTCHDVLRLNDSTVVYYVYLFSILSCLYFFLPLVITLMSYSTLIYALSVKSDRLTTSSSSSDNRRRAVIMAVAVLAEFVLCFAPTNGILLYHCVHLTNGGQREGDSSYAAYLLAVCLGSASVFLDPLLYYYGSSQCRKQIRSVFWCKNEKKRIIKLPNT